MKNKNNMYKLSVTQWNPFAGCSHDCKYCKSSFQVQIKRWAKKHCDKCYIFVPHEHPERLGQSLPTTGYMQFIFACSSGDVAFCRTEYLREIVARMRRERDRTFMLQSKDPRTFNRVTFPGNVILGTTLETNRDRGYEAISRAPKPSRRYLDFLTVKHKAKMVTVEPVLDFDLDMMIAWVENINPRMVWLGYDSRKNSLPEPDLEKVKQLHWQLSREGFLVVLKKTRDARRNVKRCKQTKVEKKIAGRRPGRGPAE